MPAVSLTDAPCVQASAPLPPVLARRVLLRCALSHRRHARQPSCTPAPFRPSRSIARQAYPNDARRCVPNAPRQPYGESR